MIALLATLLLAAPALAQDLEKPDLTIKVEPFDLKARALTFPSGLQVILQNDEKAAYISVVAAHTGGSLLDQPGKHGTARLAEQLFYWADTGHGRVRDRLYALGVQYDAQTLQDWVVFRSTGPTTALDTMLQVEGLRMDDALRGVTEEHLAQAKQVMSLWPMYRWAGGFGSAWGHILDALYPPSHPYGQTDALAWLSEYPAVTLDDVRAYDEAAFAPSETTLVISGPIDFDAAIEALFENLPPRVMHPDATEEHLRRFFKPNVVNPDPDNPEHTTVWLEDPATGELVDLTHKPVQRVEVPESIEPFPRAEDYKGEVIHVPGLVDTPLAVVAWGLPGSWVGQDTYIAIAATALTSAGLPDWSQQFEIAKGANGAVAAGCNHWVARYADHVVCTATARDNRVNAEELTDRLRAAASVFWDPNQTMLHERATDGGRRTALGQQLHLLENPAHLTQGLAARTALSAHFVGDPTYPSKFMQDLFTVDKNDLRTWVQQWMPESRAVNLVIDPIPPEQRIPIQPQGVYHSALVAHEMPPTEEPPTDAEVAAAWQPPDLSQAVTETLPNGLQVVVMPHGSIPIVTVDLVVRGGAATAQGMDTLAELAMRRLWDEIYEDPTGMKQELLPDRIGAQSTFGRGPDVTWEGFAAPRQNLDGALYLLRRNDMARRVKIAGKSNWWKATRLTLPRSWDQRSWWALQERMQRILPGHPVVWNMSQQDALRLKDATPADLLAYQARKFNPNNAVLVIAGAVDPEQALALAKKYWSDWQRDASGAVEPMPSPPQPAGPATLFFDADGADHTVVAAACPLPAPTPENSAAQKVAASALDEVFAQKLSDAGAGALAAKVEGKEGAGVSWLELTAVVPHDNAVAAVDALKQTLAVPGEGGFDPARLQQYKLRTAGESWYTRTNTRTVAQLVGEAWLLPHKGTDWYDRFGEALAAADADAIRAATEGCAANAVITVESPSGAFADMQAKFGAERIDWQARSDEELMAWDKKAYKRRLKERAKAAQP